MRSAYFYDPKGYWLSEEGITTVALIPVPFFYSAVALLIGSVLIVPFSGIAGFVGWETTLVVLYLVARKRRGRLLRLPDERFLAYAEKTIPWSAVQRVRLKGNKVWIRADAKRIQGRIDESDKKRVTALVGPKVGEKLELIDDGFHSHTSARVRSWSRSVLRV